MFDYVTRIIAEDLVTRSPMPLESVRKTMEAQDALTDAQLTYLSSVLTYLIECIPKGDCVILLNPEGLKKAKEDKDWLVSPTSLYNKTDIFIISSQNLR